MVDSPVRQRTQTPSFSISANALSDMTFPELQLDRNHKVITVSLYMDIETQAFINCGASGFACIYRDFLMTHNLPLQKLKIPRTVEVINGREIEGRDV